MWHSNSNYSLLLIHFLSLQFPDLVSLDSRGCGYSCVQESWKCTCLWMQNVINHLGASEIICYTAKAFKGQFSLLSGVFEVSWNNRQVSHPGHGCLHWPLSPRASLQLCPICWAQICLFLAQSSAKVTAMTLFPLLCCVQIHGRGWIRTCGGQPQTSLLHI